MGSGKAVIKGKTIEMQWIRVDQKSSHELLVQVKKRKEKDKWSKRLQTLSLRFSLAWNSVSSLRYLEYATTSACVSLR